MINYEIYICICLEYLPDARVDVDDNLEFNGIFDVKCLDDSLPILF